MTPNSGFTLRDARNDEEYRKRAMSKGLIDLISILDLEPLEVNLFRGNSPKTSWQRVFGGQVIGQAMVAACRTVEGRLPHSLHCYFILPGDPQIPIIYQVERLRDGKSYSTRRVTAIQHGNAIFSIMVSFHAEEEGAFDHQDKMPDVPPPEKLTAEEVAKQPMFKEMPDFIRRYYESDRPIELRPVELGRYFGQKIDDGRIHVWIRTAAKLPDDPALHMCALAYASDFSLLDAVMARYGRTLFDRRMMPASLDHAMWFHRPFRADEWLLYAQDSPSAQDGRGLTRGLIFKPDGTLVASVAQEGSVRERKSYDHALASGRARPVRIATKYQLHVPANTHGIGMMKAQAIANTIVRQRIPRPVPLKTISRRVPSIFRQIQRICAAATQAQPMMVMRETPTAGSSRDRPITMPMKLSPSGCPLEREVRDQPSEQQPIQNNLRRIGVRLFSQRRR